MKTLHSLRMFGLCVALVSGSLASGQSLPNQGGKLTHHHSWGIGNSWAGGDFEADLAMLPALSQGGAFGWSSISASANAKASLLGNQFELLDTRMASYGIGDAAYMQAYLEVLGMTIFNENGFSPSMGYGWTAYYQTPTVGLSYGIWWMSVYIKANAGMGLYPENPYTADSTKNAGLKILAGVGPNGAKGTLYAHAGIQGHIWGGIVFSFLGLIDVAGIEVHGTADLLSPTLSATLQVDLGGFAGNAVVCYTPAHLRLWLYAFCFGWTTTIDLLNQSTPKYCWTLFNF